MREGGGGGRRGEGEGVGGRRGGGLREGGGGGRRVENLQIRKTSMNLQTLAKMLIMENKEFLAI